MRDLLAYWIVKAAAGVVRRLPHGVAIALGRTVGHAVYLFDRHRKTAYANLKAAFGADYSPSELRKIARRSYIHMAVTAVEIFRFPNMNQKFIERYTEVDHAERIEECVQKKIGVILAAAHLGNWELGQMALRMRGVPIHVVARLQPQAELDELLNRYRGLRGTRTIFRGMGMREAFRTLRRGEVLAMLQDQSGGRDGMYTRFFGRLTSFPIGAFQLARRTGARLLPSFMAHTEGNRHVALIGEARIVEAHEDEHTAIRRDLEYYVEHLEREIRRRPSEWLWMHRRWKYTRTKSVAVLIDEKPGHAVQARAVFECVKKAYEQKDSETEIIAHEIPIRFKSRIHRTAAFILAFPLLPWIQSRLDLISWTLDPISAEAVRRVYADVVISCGSALTPIQAALAGENRAKKVVIMKPSFPYSLLRYDVAVIPEHDRPSTVKHSFYTDLAPNLVDGTLLLASRNRLREAFNIAAGRHVSFLVGGDTRDYQMDARKIEEVMRTLLAAAEREGFKLLVTTSRRTRPDIEQLAKRYFHESPYCSALIIANEKNMNGAVYGMIDLADITVATEDSISMISESVSTHKPVVVVRVGQSRLRPKYERFQKLLGERHYAVVSSSDEVDRCLMSLLRREEILAPCRDRERLTDRLVGAL